MCDDGGEVDYHQRGAIMKTITWVLIGVVVGLVLWLMASLMWEILTQIRCISQDSSPHYYVKGDFRADFYGHMVLARKPRIDVYFCTYQEWVAACKKFYPDKEPRSMGAFCVHYLNLYDRYEIYIPAGGASDCSMDEHSFGHEVLHILKWDWHKGQKPTMRCGGGKE